MFRRDRAEHSRSSGLPRRAVRCDKNAHPIMQMRCLTGYINLTVSPVRCMSAGIQQVSYHRDHVYLFDATGASRSSSAVSDPALSSYFIPALPPPPASLSKRPPQPATPGGASIAPDADGGGQVGGVSGGAARPGRGEESDAPASTAVRVLEVHRALAAWDGRGGMYVVLPAVEVL